MIRNFKYYFQLKPTVEQSAGCIFYINGENEVKGDLCILNNENGVITIKENFQDLDLEEIASHVSDIPVNCILDGDLVVHRRLEQRSSVDSSIDEYIKLIMPSADSANFYVQVFQNTKCDIISAVRKEIVDEFLDQLIEYDFFLFSLSMGPFSIQHITSLLDDDTEKIFFRHGFVTVDEKEITDLKYCDVDETSHIEFAGESLNAEWILPYIASLNSFSEFDPILRLSEISLIDKSRREFTYKNLYLRLIKIAPAVLILVLIINTLLFIYYSSENQELTSTYGTQFNRILLSDSLSNSIKNQETILASLNWSDGNQCSYLLDRIGSSVDPGVTLLSMDLFPVDQEKLDREEVYDFEPKEIIIEGFCFELAPLTRWVTTLNQYEWIESVNNQVYKWNDEKKRGEFSFLLTLSQ